MAKKQELLQQAEDLVDEFKERINDFHDALATDDELPCQRTASRVEYTRDCIYTARADLLEFIEKLIKRG